MAPMRCPAQREPANDYLDSYSLTHLAHRWGVSRRDIRQMLQCGELPFVQIEGQLRVTAAAVRMIELADSE